MSLRTRLSVWFAAVLTLSLLAMGVNSYYELVVEPLQKKAANPPEATDPPAIEIGEALLYCGIPALALGLAGGWWLIRRALSPVVALMEAAERINEHHLHEHLPLTGNGDELDRLTEVFNRMTERLDHSFARIREFTLHASHELKTPLTVMHGELETALQTSDVTAAERSRLESQMDEVQRLSRIVDGLTLLTKADAGQIALEHKPVRLDELVREAHADALSLARPHEIQASLERCEEVTVIGDRHRIRQLLLNLTDNAIKYNQQQGKVVLSLAKRDDQALLEISNSGVGIARESLARIYEPFFRGDPSHSSEVEGCGLGLSIVRWIVNAHGGTIEITSELGKMTTATVRLPSV